MANLKLELHRATMRVQQLEAELQVGKSELDRLSQEAVARHGQADLALQSAKVEWDNRCRELNEQLMIERNRATQIEAQNAHLQAQCASLEEKYLSATGAHLCLLICATQPLMWHLHR